MGVLETEIKLMEIDLNAVMSRLGKLGISFQKSAQRDFMVLVSGTEVARVRQVSDKVYMTSKKRNPDIDHFKRATEATCVVLDFEGAKRFLTHRFEGRPYFEYTKHREIFEVGSAKCELVDIELSNGTRPLGCYLEIEGDEEEIRRTISLLGLDHCKTSNEGIPNLLRAVGHLPRTLGSD